MSILNKKNLGIWVWAYFKLEKKLEEIEMIRTRTRSSVDSKYATNIPETFPKVLMGSAYLIKKLSPMGIMKHLSSINEYFPVHSEILVGGKWVGSYE